MPRGRGYLEFGALPPPPRGQCKASHTPHRITNATRYGAHVEYHHYQLCSSFYVKIISAQSRTQHYTSSTESWTHHSSIIDVSPGYHQCITPYHWGITGVSLGYHWGITRVSPGYHQGIASNLRPRGVHLRQICVRLAFNLNKGGSNLQ